MCSSWREAGWLFDGILRRASSGLELGRGPTIGTRSECKDVRTDATDETDETQSSHQLVEMFSYFLYRPTNVRTHLADPRCESAALSMLLGVLEHGRSSTGSTANPAYIACPPTQNPSQSLLLLLLLLLWRVCVYASNDHTSPIIHSPTALKLGPPSWRSPKLERFVSPPHKNKKRRATVPKSRCLPKPINEVAPLTNKVETEISSYLSYRFWPMQRLLHAATASFI